MMELFIEVTKTLLYICTFFYVLLATYHHNKGNNDKAILYAVFSTLYIVILQGI